MESIDALAKAVNVFEGGLVLVSHDMRLISQVAKEIWICDHKTITKYQGDIMNFKMDMRALMGIDGTGSNNNKKLKGDASVKASDKAKAGPKPTPKPEPILEVIRPVVASIRDGKKAITSPPVAAPIAKPAPLDDDATATTVSTATTASSGDAGEKKKYIPPHLRKKMQQQS